MSPSGNGVPETGADFLQFLLGLQVNPQSSLFEKSSEEGLDGLLGKKPSEEEALLQMFGKKEKSTEELSPFALSVNPFGMDVQRLTKPEEKVPTEGLEQARNTKDGEVAEAKFEVGQFTEMFVDEKSQMSKFEKPNSDASVEVAIQKYLAAEPQMETVTESNGVKTPLQTQVASQENSVGSDFDRMRLKEVFKKNESGKSTEKSDKLSHSAGAGLSMSELTNVLGPKAQVVSVSHNSPAAEARMAQIPDLFGKVATMAYNGGGKMTVALNPPHLGEVTIQVTTRGDKVEIEMSSGRDSTRHLMEQGVPDLIQSIEAQDLVVSKMEIHRADLMNSSLQNDGFTASQQSGEFYKQSDGYSRQSENQARSNSFDSAKPSLRDSSITHVQGRAMGAGGLGRVDLRI